MRPAWRWLRELLVRLGRREARGWKTPDDVLAALEMELPRFRGVRAAAPAAAWRRDGRKVARQPLRWSGRTALDADRTVFEPGPAPDPDSPLAFSLEGLQPTQSPDELRARTWWPGWNSNNGLHKFGEELEALRPGRALRRPPAGRRPAGRELPPVAAPAALRAAGRRRACSSPLHLIFGSEQLSMYTPGVAERAPAPFIGLNEEDAERLGVRDGDWLELWLPWMDARAALRAGAVARDGHGRRARRPPRPPLHLAAGARAASRARRHRRERRARSRRASSPPAPPPGTGSC